MLNSNDGMKAIVIKSGKQVTIIRNSAFDKDLFYTSEGESYYRHELNFID